MRVLFFPSDLGGGFGHTSRCVALALEAKVRGHSCAFVLGGERFAETVGKHFTVHLSNAGSGPRKPRSGLRHSIKNLFGGKRNPIYTEFSGLGFQVVRDGLTDRGAILNVLKRYGEIIREFDPDVLIGDTNLLAGIAAERHKVPVVQIVRYAFHPRTSDLIWWKPLPAQVKEPDVRGIFNPTLGELGVGEISRTEDLLKGDLYLIPSIPEIEPVPAQTDTFHVGHLISTECDGGASELDSHPDSDSREVYVTVGGGAGLVGSELFFHSVIDAFSDFDGRVFVSTGNRFDPARFAHRPEHILFSRWLPGKRMISSSAVTIFHGGYGTMMEVLCHGKPSLVIPSHSEQESNGRRLEQCGCGVVMSLSEQELYPVRMSAPWGEWSYGTRKRFDLKPERIREVVERMMKGDSKHSRVAKDLQRRITSYGGPRQAMGLVEEHFGSQNCGY